MAGEVTPVAQAARNPAAGARLWGALRSPWLLAAVLALIAAVLVAGQLLPQMPANVADDPVARTRWLNNAASGGAGAELAGALGLFAAAQSGLLQVLLGAAAVLLSAHMADALARWSALRRLPAVLDLPAGEAGEPLTLAHPATLHRWRGARLHPPEAAVEDVAARLGGAFPSIQRREVARAQDRGEGEAGETGEADTQPRAQVEHRLLAVRNAYGAWLLPLFYAGLAVALAALWGNALLGWQVQAAAIAPGAGFADAAHAVALDYSVEAQGAGVQPRAVISATVGGASGAVSMDGGSKALGGARVRAVPGTPALWLDAGETPLLRAGDAQESASLGLLFPQVGSEELVLLPAGNAGLRIVRLGPEQGGGDPTTEPRYLVELYEGDDVQPVQRFEIDSARTVALELSDGPVEIALANLPAADVRVSRQPWLWLLIPGLLAAATGALGLWKCPAFALVQVAPWPVDRAVVTVQSDRADVVEDVRIAVGRASQPDEPAGPDGS